MNRREIIKFSLLSPLLGLFKAKPAIPDKCPCGCGMPNYLNLPATNSEAYITKLKRRFSDRLMASETTGTSSEGPVVYWTKDGNGPLVACTYDRNYEITKERWVTLEYDYKNERVLMKPVPNEEFYKGQ